MVKWLQKEIAKSNRNTFLPFYCLQNLIVKYELLPLSEKTNFLTGSCGEVLASLKLLLKLALTSKEIVTSPETIQCDRVAQRVAKLFSVNVHSTALEVIMVNDSAAN